jgi:hypothetical protein
MNVLAILYCFPPLQYPATMCYLKLVKGLLDLGVGVDVVTIEPESFHAPGFRQIDESLRELVPPGLQDLKVRSPERDIVFRLIKGLGLAHRLLHRFVEPKKVEWIRPALKMLLARGLKRYDVILSCSQPHANQVLGLELKKRSGKPWIAYLSDPWVDNVYTTFKTERIRAHHLRLEGEVFRQANRIFFTSPEMRDLVMKKYSADLRSKVGVLPHSFVPEWYELARKRYPGKGEGGRFHFVHTGYFYGPRSPVPFFAGLEGALSDGNVPVEARFEFWGGMAPQYESEIGKRGLSRHVSVHGTVSYLESLSILSSAGNLFLIDAPLGNASESVFLPSKLIDYLGSGSPVVGFTPLSGASARVLQETGNAVADVNSARIREYLGSIFSGKVQGIKDRGNTADYEYRAVTSRLVRTMQEIA